MGLFNRSNSQEQSSSDAMQTQVEELIASLEKRIFRLEERVQELEDKLENAASVEAETSTDAPAVEVSFDDASSVPVVITNLDPEPPKSRQIYLAAPNPDGTFSAFSSEVQIGKSIYLLTTSDGVHGTFIMIDSSDAVATACISVSQMVKPACKVIGNPSMASRSVITDEEGTAEFQNGSWRVTQKAVVRFM